MSFCLVVFQSVFTNDFVKVFELGFFPFRD